MTKAKQIELLIKELSLATEAMLAMAALQEALTKRIASIEVRLGEMEKSIEASKEAAE